MKFEKYGMGIFVVFTTLFYFYEMIVQKTKVENGNVILYPALVLASISKYPYLIIWKIIL